MQKPDYSYTVVTTMTYYLGGGGKYPVILKKKKLHIAGPLILLRLRLFTKAALQPFTEAVEVVFSRASVAVSFFLFFFRVVIPRLLVLCSAPANPDSIVVAGS